MAQLNIQSYDFFKKLCEQPNIEQIILYGSRARGDNQTRSNIDIAIKGVDNDVSWNAVMEIVDEADTLYTIDCLRYETLDGDSELKLNIDKDGITLLNRNNIHE